MSNSSDANLTKIEEQDENNAANEVKFVSQPAQSSNEDDHQNDVISNSSDESNRFMDTKDAMMMFDKLAKESIQKIM